VQLRNQGQKTMAFDSEVLQCARTLFEHRFEEEIRPAYNNRLWETKTKFTLGRQLPFSGMDAQRLIAVEVQFAREAANAQADCLVAAIKTAGLKFDNEALVIGLNNTRELLNKHKYSATNTVFSAFAPQIDPATKTGIEQDLDAKLARIHDSVLSLLKSKLAEAILLAKAETNNSGDKVFARMAIDEARKSVSENDGRPRPKVGAVIVKSGQVLSTAYRGEFRGNHAEFIALEKKLNDEAIVGATVYTTLEPCTTRNPPKIPCVERLIARRVARVVIGMIDPDIRISGQGIRKLVNANIEVSLFPHDLVLELEELNREFTRFCEKRPEKGEHDKHSDPWLDLFREKQRLEEEVASLEAQVPSMRVIPAMKIGMDDFDILVEKLGRKKKQVKEIEERMSRY
jgi:pyrimidine deaminase RibD-like protein